MKNQIDFQRTKTIFNIKGIIHFGKVNHRTKGVFYFLDIFNKEIIGK
jgi:hypothetical protein